MCACVVVVLLFLFSPVLFKVLQESGWLNGMMAVNDIKSSYFFMLTAANLYKYKAFLVLRGSPPLVQKRQRAARHGYSAKLLGICAPFNDSKVIMTCGLI